MLWWTFSPLCKIFPAKPTISAYPANCLNPIIPIEIRRFALQIMALALFIIEMFFGEDDSSEYCCK